MKDCGQKREFLCQLAEIYLDTKKSSYISVSDGIMDSHDFDSISFLMLLALIYTKEEALSVYSIDIDLEADARNYFLDKEYSKIMKIKKSQVELGKIILDDAKMVYLSQFSKIDDDIDIEKSDFFFRI